MQNSSSDIDAIRQVVNQVLEVHAREEGGQRSQARSEILIHSMQVFAQRGLQRTTVQHLLDASDVSRRTFYKYFRNKMDVLESIYRIFVDNMLLHFHKEVKQASSARDIIRNTTQVPRQHGPDHQADDGRGSLLSLGAGTAPGPGPGYCLRSPHRPD